MYKIESIEDQVKFIVPMNRDTEHIFYNIRMIIDNKVETQPRCWKVTKVNRVQSDGVCMVTLAQDLFDSNRDYIEKDEYGNIIGMWADWIPKDQYTLQSENRIDPSILPDYHLSLLFTGVKPVIKVGGTFKKITANFLDKHNNEVQGVFVDFWKIYLDDIDINELEDNPIIIVDSSGDSKLSNNQIKIKYSGTDKYLGKILKIVAEKDGLVDELNMEVVGL